MEPPARLSRRRLLQIGAAMGSLPAVLAACAQVAPVVSESARASGRPGSFRPSASASASPTRLPSQSPVAGHATLYRGAALADGRSSTLQRPLSVLVDGGRVAWIRPTDGEED